MDRRAFLHRLSAALGVFVFGAPGSRSTAPTPKKPRGKSAVTAASFIWSASAASAGGLTNSQNDYTLPVATADSSRELVVVMQAFFDPVGGGLDPAIFVNPTVSYSTDPTFLTGVSTFASGTGGAGWAAVGNGAGDTDHVVGFWWAYLPIANGTDGYVRVTTSTPLDQVQTLMLLGSIDDTNATAHWAERTAPGGISSNPVGPPGSSAYGWNTPANGLAIQSLVTRASSTATVSGSWNQQQVTNRLSAGGASSSEIRGATSYSYPSAAAGHVEFDGSVDTGAQWTLGTYPIQAQVNMIWFAAAATVLRRARAWAIVIG